MEIKNKKHLTYYYFFKKELKEYCKREMEYFIRVENLNKYDVLYKIFKNMMLILEELENNLDKFEKLSSQKLLNLNYVHSKN